MTNFQNYSNMQRDVYERISDGMAVGNHRQHDSNPDYKGILLKDIVDNFDSNRKIFEFGFGCGRNIINIKNMGYVFVDGCDISSNNKNHTIEKMKSECGGVGSTRLFVTDGNGINGVESNYYDFVFSTIVMQHICVYDIRFNILKDKYRILKDGGVLSFQMGYDNFEHGRYGIKYHENKVDATNTNGFCDVCVMNPEDVKNDLLKIGFKDITYQIRPVWEDDHHNWIFIRAVK